MKKIIITIVTAIIVIVIAGLYYNYPRKVHFELVMEIEKPYPEFDLSHDLGFAYAENEEKFMYWLVDYIKKCNKNKGRAGAGCYTKDYVEELAKELDFTKYDYLIAWQKEIKELRHSPYLTNDDSLFFDKRTPLFATWDGIITDKVYIYRIKKNKRFRAPGP